MAAEGPPAPSPRTSGTAAPPEEAAVETETPQDLSQSGYRPAACLLPLASDVRDRGFRGRGSLHNLPRSPPPPPPPPPPPRAAQDSAATQQGKSCCSEEFVLNYTFTVCDPEQTGTVLAWRVVEYLQAVTGQSSEEGQLRALHRMLDPEAAGAALDLPTFRAIMREWITSCQQEGSVQGNQGQKAVPRVPASTTNSSHLSRGPRFAEEWDVAAGDLGLVLAGGGRSGLLGSGTAPKRWCLAVPGSSQQALEQARATAEELEDLKAVAKGLEEENSELRQQARQLVRGPASSLPVSPQLPPRCQAGMRGTSSEPHVFPPQEKEQRCLSSQANNLQEEVRTPPGAMGKGACPGSAGVVVNTHPFCPKQNQRLVAEGRGLRQQIQALSAEMADLEVSGVGGVHTAWPMPSASLSANKAGVCPPAPPSLSPCPVAQLPAHALANAASSFCQAQLSSCTVLLSSRDVALAQVSTTRGRTQLWPPLRQPSAPSPLPRPETPPQTLRPLTTTLVLQAGLRVEELTVALEEYDRAVQVRHAQPRHAPQLGGCSPPTPPGHREPHTGQSQNPWAAGRAAAAPCHSGRACGSSGHGAGCRC
uniref:Protein KASH5 EF-hand-like domain-containing protein n=1 Tax=Accipiter nisus TaxID=211598 RepID=A0A8B9MRS0_9AVES